MKEQQIPEAEQENSLFPRTGNALVASLV